MAMKLPTWPTQAPMRGLPLTTGSLPAAAFLILASPFGEIADAPLGIENSGLFTAGRAVAQQLHNDLLTVGLWSGWPFGGGGSCVGEPPRTSAAQNAPGNAPPSISRFWPVM